MPPELTIQFIRNYTAEPIGLAVQEAAQQIGLSVKTHFGPYENLGAETAALSASAEAPAVAVLTMDLDYFAGGIFAPGWSQAEAASELDALLVAADAACARSFILISTFIPPFGTSLPWAPGHPVLGKDTAAFQLNTTLREFVAERPNRCGLLDFERIAARLGEAATLDRRFGLMMKAPYKQEFVAAAAQEILRYLKCRFLPPKKVLVLDCDNTLWGGLAGECGPEQLELDPYEYPGIAYYRFQSEVLSVAEKGVLICLCSKNDESSVWEVMERHPHCLLKRAHLAGYRVNWGDKATNLKELAVELNLGLDSMVFVDDEPAECELIRSQFPEVSVLQVPGRIYNYPGVLRASGMFDRLSVSQEDRERAQYYQADKGRREIQSRHVDAEGFLRDLRMKAAVRSVQDADLPRAAQLCQRTNQFNLTSRRYSESDLAALLGSPDVRMFLLHAEDRFGPLGQSGLIIWRRSGGVAEVDTFLMSCRLIGRSLDKALFCGSLRALEREGPVEELRATFIASLRNGIVSGLWEDYGFRSGAPQQGSVYTCKASELRVGFPEVVELREHL